MQWCFSITTEQYGLLYNLEGDFKLTVGVRFVYGSPHWSYNYYKELSYSLDNL